MDALALLCTLHADGPATWRRLRENGCHSLPELARFEPVELSEIIGGTTAGAKRFLREARHLGERSGSAWLEREEPVALPVAAPQALADESELPVHDQQIVENVLRAWREEDTKQLSQDLPEAQPVSAPEPVAAPGQHALEPNLVDGLSEGVCERLGAEGIHTLEQLLEADPGPLALRSGLGYSRLYRWRSLSERLLRALAAAPAPAQGDPERLSPAESPLPVLTRDLLQIPARGLDLPRRTLRWSPLEEGAAGPFA